MDQERLTRDQAREVLTRTEGLALTYAGCGPHSSPEKRGSPQPSTGASAVGRRKHRHGRAIRPEGVVISVHHDGSVTLAAAVGGHRMRHPLSTSRGGLESPVAVGGMDVPRRR